MHSVEPSARAADACRDDLVHGFWHGPTTSGAPFSDPCAGRCRWVLPRPQLITQKNLSNQQNCTGLCSVLNWGTSTAVTVLCQNGRWAANQDFNENLRPRLDFPAYRESHTMFACFRQGCTVLASDPHFFPRLDQAGRSSECRTTYWFQGYRVSQPGSSPTMYCLKSDH